MLACARVGRQSMQLLVAFHHAESHRQVANFSHVCAFLQPSRGVVAAKQQPPHQVHAAQVRQRAARSGNRRQKRLQAKQCQVSPAPNHWTHATACS